MSVTSVGYKVGKQPIAQSFFVDESRGIYVTKVDLFFKSADENAPIQVQLRNMINGFPSSNTILPGSVKSLPGSTFSGGASVSADASVATTFEFDEPIYLKGKQDYALVVIADSKEYEIYVAQINEFVVGSTEKRINKQPILGSLFYSQNGATFTAAQNQDLTFVLHRARFKTKNARVILRNSSVPLRLLDNNPITTTATSQTVEIFHPNHGMQVGQPVEISGVDSSGVGGIFASTLNKRHNVVAIDHTGFTITADSAADSDAIGGGSLVKSTRNIQYSTIYPNMASITPAGSNIEAKIKTTTGKSLAGSETAFQKSSVFETITLNQNNRTNSLKLVAHDSAETSELGAGVKSLDMELALSGESASAPMIDLQRSSVNLISNIIDKQDSASTSGFNVPLQFVPETTRIGGSSPSKHLTKIITLPEESVGMKVILTASRPEQTDFELYFRSANDNEQISIKDFTLISQEAFVPNSIDNMDFKNYTYLIGGLGGDAEPFTKYQLKIVFRSTNQAVVPTIKALRSISLSV